MKKLFLLSALTILVILTSLIPTFAADPIIDGKLTKESLTTELLSSSVYNKLEKTDWLKKQADRDIEHLPYERLVELTTFYPEKINRMTEIYGQTKEQTVLDEIARLKDKFITVVKELEYRDKDEVPEREIHHTTYYIDLNAGNDGNTGLSIAQAWRTIEKYTTTTVRTAGDIAWVRANTSEIPVGDIAFDEDGTVTGGYIEIRGCSAAAGEDPWGDASNVKPIINLNATTNSVVLNGDDYWRLYRLDITNGAGSTGLISVSAGVVVLDYVDVHLSTHASTAIGIYTSQAYIRISNSTFYSNKHYNIRLLGQSEIIDSTLDGGATGTNYGISMNSGGLTLINVLFGSVTPHTTASITNGNTPGGVCSYNCLFADATEYVGNPSGIFYSEDHDQVKGAHKTWQGGGTTARDSTIQLDSHDSVLMTPSSIVSAINPLTISGGQWTGAYQVWCPAAATTIQIKARETAAWAADPTAAQFYFKASYLNAGAGGTRATTVSAQTLSGTSEVTFTVTFTPSQAGWVYIDAFLEVYEAGKSVNISVVPSAS